MSYTPYSVNRDPGATKERSTSTMSWWGGPGLKSGALQLQILRSLERMPRHPLKAPGLQTVKSVKSTDAPGRAPISLKVLKAPTCWSGSKS